jgi:hypothetical protein
MTLPFSCPLQFKPCPDARAIFGGFPRKLLAIDSVGAQGRRLKPEGCWLESSRGQAYGTSPQCSPGRSVDLSPNSSSPSMAVGGIRPRELVATWRSRDVADCAVLIATNTLRWEAGDSNSERTFSLTC